MNIYEDEEADGKVDVVAFLRRNKQLVIWVIAFLIAYSLMSLASRQLDGAVAAEQAADAAAHKSPWSK